MHPQLFGVKQFLLRKPPMISEAGIFPSEEFELIVITVKDWSRIVRGLLTQTVLRKFWSDLRGCLKAVKRRGQLQSQ